MFQIFGNLDVSMQKSHNSWIADGLFSRVLNILRKWLLTILKFTIVLRKFLENRFDDNCCPVQLLKNDFLSLVFIMIFSIQLNVLLSQWLLYSPTAWKGSTARGSDAAAFITEGWGRRPRKLAWPAAEEGGPVLCQLIFIWFFKLYDNSKFNIKQDAKSNFKYGPPIRLRKWQNIEQYISWQGESRDRYFQNSITSIAEYEGHIWNYDFAWSTLQTFSDHKSPQ